jgi:hypothetical protein
MSPKAWLVVAALVMSLIGSAAAHHSGAAYDIEHMQTLQGTVKQVNWTNPHISFVIEADAQDGKPANTWVFEVSSPGVLSRSGWTKRSLQVGDHATFSFAPLRDGRPGGLLRKVTLQNGQELTYTLQPEEQ